MLVKRAERFHDTRKVHVLQLPKCRTITYGKALVTPDRTIFWSCDFCRFELHATDRECLVS